MLSEKSKVYGSVYSIVLCKGRKGDTDSYLHMYTHNNVWKNTEQTSSGGYLFARRLGAGWVGDGMEI